MIDNLDENPIVSLNNHRVLRVAIRNEDPRASSTLM